MKSLVKSLKRTQKNPVKKWLSEYMNTPDYDVNAIRAHFPIFERSGV